MQKEIKEKQAQNATALRQMKETEGWQLYEKFLKNEYTRALTSLRGEDDPMIDIMTWKGRCEAIERIFKWLDIVIDYGEMAGTILDKERELKRKQESGELIDDY